MVDWGFVAVILAIAAYPLQAFAIPALLQFVKVACVKLYILLWPRAGKCDSFEWHHFPEGSIHLQSANHRVCPDPICLPANIHQTFQSGIWQDSLSFLFPPAWNSSNREKVTKPKQLSPTTKYIRTDPDTLLAYVLGISFFCEIWHDKELFEETIELQKDGGVLVGRLKDAFGADDKYGVLMSDHFTLNGAHNRLVDCNKEYIHQQVQGRQSLQQLALRNGLTVRSPLQTPDDSRRGGWILAAAMAADVSFGNFSPRFRSPAFLLPVVRTGLVNSGFVYDKFGKAMIKVPPHVYSSLQRVRLVLEQILLPGFPGSSDIECTIATIEAMQAYFSLYGTTGSDREIAFSAMFLDKDPSARIADDHFRHLDSADCEFILQLFNKSSLLTEDELRRVKPLLLLICRAALAGIFLVVGFYSYKENFFVEPELLKKHRYIYLVDSPME